MRFSSLGQPHFHGEDNTCILNFIMISTKREKKVLSFFPFEMVFFVFICICFRVEDIVTHFYSANLLLVKEMVCLKGWSLLN